MKLPEKFADFITKCGEYEASTKLILGLIIIPYFIIQIPIILLLYGTGVKIMWMNVLPGDTSNVKMWGLSVRTFKVLLNEWWDVEFDYENNDYYDK